MLQYQQRPALASAPYAGNPNLAAQSGVFTVDYDAADDTRPFEVFLEQHLEQLIGPRPWTPSNLERQSLPLQPLLKVTLPTSQGPELLRRLASEGVSAATIFPGYAGVKQSLDEQALWDRRPWDKRPGVF